MMVEMICAGFGGQGVLTTGLILAETGMKLGMNVLGTLPLDEAEDDGEHGKGRKHSRGSHRKKRKKKLASA